MRLRLRRRQRLYDRSAATGDDHRRRTHRHLIGPPIPRATLTTNKLFRIALQFAYEIARAADWHGADAASVYISDDAARRRTHVLSS